MTTLVYLHAGSVRSFVSQSSRSLGPASRVPVQRAKSSLQATSTNKSKNKLAFAVLRCLSCTSLRYGFAWSVILMWFRQLSRKGC